MGNVTIITATRGIGIHLAQHVVRQGMSCETIGVACADVGVSDNLPPEPVDYCIDISAEYNLDKLHFKPSTHIIWSTGAFLKWPLSEMTDEHISTLTELHYNMPLRLLKRFHKQQSNPYHLIVIASCSSWRLRQQEAVYCGLSAAKAAFARNFAGDLQQERPGSKVTLINPGGIRTPFYYELEEEGKGFIDPTWLSEYIWLAARQQQKPFLELQILRKKPVVEGSKPTIVAGQVLPEVSIVA